MNKLLIPNGGMPLYGDDFAFLDNAQRDALKGMIYELALPHMGKLILGGCELSTSGGNMTISPGYVLIDYEICWYPGETLPIPGGGAIGSFSLDTYFDPAGLKTFANSTSQNTHQVRRARFTAGGIADNGLDLPNGSTKLSFSIYELLGQYLSATSIIPMENGWQRALGVNAPILYRHFRNVHFAGDFVPGTLSQTVFTHIGTISEPSFRPVKRFKAIVPAYESTTPVYGNLMLEVFTDGTIYAIATSADTWGLVSVNLSFLAA